MTLSDAPVEPEDFEVFTPSDLAMIDQSHARANHELDLNINSAQLTRAASFAAGHGDAEATAVVAITIIESERIYDRNRLGSLFAAALVRLAKARYGTLPGDDDGQG